MKKIIDKAKNKLYNSCKKAAALVRISRTDTLGAPALDLVIELLVGVILIGIVLGVMQGSVQTWATSITTKVSDLLNNGVPPAGGGGGALIIVPWWELF